MDVDSTYSTDVTIRDTEDHTRGLASQVTHRKGRGFQDHHVREEMPYEVLDSQTREAGPAQSIQGWILIVTNIHHEATEEDIANIFGEFGKLESLHLNIDRRTGYVKGYALIEYEIYRDAERAQQENMKRTLYNVPLGVDWAFSNGPLYRNT
ncbi:RNA-binding protein 8A [Thelohanellus kitauei]|uniref:RNA-binding protein 8A n=1 Tax=Thelohanellus kitauei TaxID=669202 RepID=A0A0C2JXK1_THEKT|nr:RNA-binding protein 8A [Thelohanellus kitauei]